MVVLGGSCIFVFHLLHIVYSEESGLLFAFYVYQESITASRVPIRSLPAEIWAFEVPGPMGRYFLYIITG